MVENIIKTNDKFSVPLSVPVIAGNEWNYVKDCLDTAWVSYLGKYVTLFEEKVAQFVGSKYAISTVSGTAALHISLILSGVEAGDEVIVPTLTFIAPVNTVKYCGAEPVFIDCDPNTLCINITQLQNFLDVSCRKKEDGYTYNKITGRRIKAVIPVHVFGHPSDMKALVEICKHYNIHIVEDSTESIGSEYNGQKTGSFGRFGCFSFNGNKIITAGGGGMIVTNDENLARRSKHLTTQAKIHDFEFDHDEIGYNYRLTNVQAAIGLAQMEKLDEIIQIKRKNLQVYKELLLNLSKAELLLEIGNVKSNCWFYTLKVGKHHKLPLAEYLLAAGVQVRPIWKLMHTLPMFSGAQISDFSNAIQAYERCISLPCSVNLTIDQIEYVVKQIINYFNKN